MKVLIVDDDVDTLDITAYALRREGYTVVTAVDGRQALQRWESEKPDLVILDVMLPKVNGLDICRKIRSESNVPVLMLTARDQDDDVVRGLDFGADDYIVKPFSHKQLVARIRAATRRAGTQQSAKQSDQVTAGGMVLDVDTHEVTRAGTRIRLTPLEFRLLYCLASNDGRLLFSTPFQLDIDATRPATASVAASAQAVASIHKTSKAQLALNPTSIFNHKSTRNPLSGNDTKRYSISTRQEV